MHFNTSQFRYSDIYRCDVTYRTKDPIGKLFCPTAKLVFDYKNGKIDEKEYTVRYYELMRNSYRQNKQQWLNVLNGDNRIVFVCYCNSESFCHRKLLVNILTKLNGIYDGEI